MNRESGITCGINEIYVHETKGKYVVTIEGPDTIFVNKHTKPEDTQPMLWLTVHNRKDIPDAIEELEKNLELQVEFTRSSLAD